MLTQRATPDLHLRRARQQASPPLPGGRESFTYDQFIVVVDAPDMDGSTSWVVYDNSQNRRASWAGCGRVRYTERSTATQVSGIQRTTRLGRRIRFTFYDDGASGPGAEFFPPSAEQTHMGRVAEVEAWTSRKPLRPKPTRRTRPTIAHRSTALSVQRRTLNSHTTPGNGRKVRLGREARRPQATPLTTQLTARQSGRTSSGYTVVLYGTSYGTFTGINQRRKPEVPETPSRVSYT